MSNNKFFAVDYMGELISAHEETEGENEIEIVNPALGDCADEEYDAELQRLEDCYTECEGGTRYTVRVRRSRAGEADGTYIAGQILGYSIPKPADLIDLDERAWALFCE